MDDPIIEDEQASEALYADLKTAGGNSGYEDVHSAPKSAAHADLQIISQDPQSAGGSGLKRLLLILILLLATVSALAGAFPGPASGLVPLAMDVIGVAGPVLAALLAALGAILVLMSSQRSDATAQALNRADRLLYLGNGTAKIFLGNAGLQIDQPSRVWRADWDLFDAANLIDAEVNPATADDGTRLALPAITKSDVKGVTLEALLFDADAPPAAVDALLAQCSEWADKADFIRLPLLIDKDKGSDQANQTKTGPHTEFLRVDRKFFDSLNESKLTWAQFVAACTLLIQAHDKRWR